MKNRSQRTRATNGALSAWVGACSLALWGLPVASQAAEVRSEAEDGKLSGGTEVRCEIPGYSGTGYVDSFKSREAAVEIDVRAPATGFYHLVLGYAAYLPKYNPVFVNGSMQRLLYFPRTWGFAETVVGRVYLDAGANVIKIGSDWGEIAVDYARIEAAAEPVKFALSDKPVTPGASPEARALFAKLTGLFGSKILAGQQDELGRRRPNLEAIAGKLPAIVGFDLMNSSGAYNRPDGQIARARDLALEQGGIVTISWHWFSPLGAMDPVWKSFGADQTTFDIRRVSDPDSAEHEAVIRDLDLVAAQLAVLRDARVPVLWRPLHEAEGGWFWWGAGGPEAAKGLYRLMFDRFTRVHKLNNLLWVWTSTDSPHAHQWYPGDDVVDMVGADIYPSDGVRGTFLAAFDVLRETTRGRKAIALCETSAVPDADRLAAERADWLWFLIWDDYIERSDINPPERIRAAYRSEQVITLDELKQWSSGGAEH